MFILPRRKSEAVIARLNQFSDGRHLGFRGQVFTVRADDLAGKDGRPDAFFDTRMMAT